MRDLFLMEVTGTEFSVPAEVNWAPGAVYRWKTVAVCKQRAAVEFPAVLSPNASLVLLQNCIRHTSGFNRRLDIVSTQDVRSFQDQRSLGGKRSEEAVLRWSIFAVAGQRPPNVSRLTVTRSCQDNWS